MVTVCPGPMRLCNSSANSSRVGGLSLLTPESDEAESGRMLTGHLLLEVGGVAEQAVPQDPRDAEFVGVETLPDPALGVVGKVLGVVEPPGPVVVPEVVVRVVRGADGQDGTI